MRETHRGVFEDLEGGRGREGKPAVLAAGHAAAQGHGPRIDGLNPQLRQGGGDAHDVEDGVGGPHLVEVHLLGGNPVDRGLGTRQHLEDLQCASGGRLIQGGVRDEGPDVAIGTVMVFLVDIEVQVKGAYPLHLPDAGADGEGPEAETVVAPSERLQGTAQVDEAAEDHVAAGPAHRVEYEHLHGLSLPS